MKAQLIGVRNIWDAAPHNAFTDLTRFRNRWYCTFREAATHMSEDGRLRIIRSSNGVDWEGAGLVISPNSDIPDLRDPKIIVGPKDQLILMGTGTARGGCISCSTYLWFSDDGIHWSEGTPAGNMGLWLWSLTRDHATLYSAAYSGVEGDALSRISLYKTEEGACFFEFVSELYSDELYPNETAVSIHEGIGVAVIRREFAPGESSPRRDGTAVLASAKAPFKEWDLTDLGIYIGGPALLRLPSGKFLLSGRTLPSAARTALWELDVERQKVNELLILPSGGDCSYPGMVWHQERLWISYYSKHEGKSCIYFAEIELSSDG